jgi:hypothetical protein
MKVKKSQKTKKYFAGGALTTAALAQGALGLGKAGFGLFQRGAANRELDRLRENQPDVFVPTALRKLANEAVSREYMDSMEEGAQRRTSQAIGALGKGGSRTLAGSLPTVLDNERVGERERAAGYEQERKRALGALANAEQRVQDQKINMWQQDVAGARGELGAGQQNFFSGLESTAASTPYIPFSGTAWNKAYRPNATFGDVDPVQKNNLSTLPMSTFKDGGKVQVTEGSFSHDKNPLTLVTKTGEVAKDKDSGATIELTGQETVIAPDDIKKMTKLAKKDGGALAKNFLKLMKSFNSKK